MILIEIENKNTGAKLQVPGRYTFIKETFEKSVENYTWEEWTAPAETTAANVREDFNTETHSCMKLGRCCSNVLCGTGRLRRSDKTAQKMIS